MICTTALASEARAAELGRLEAKLQKVRTAGWIPRDVRRAYLISSYWKNHALSNHQGALRAANQLLFEDLGHVTRGFERIARRSTGTLHEVSYALEPKAYGQISREQVRELRDVLRRVVLTLRHDDHDLRRMTQSERAELARLLGEMRTTRERFKIRDGVSDDEEATNTLKEAFDGVLSQYESMKTQASTPLPEQPGAGQAPAPLAGPLVAPGRRYLQLRQLRRAVRKQLSASAANSPEVKQIAAVKTELSNGKLGAFTRSLGYGMASIVLPAGLCITYQAGGDPILLPLGVVAVGLSSAAIGRKAARLTRLSNALAVARAAGIESLKTEIGPELRAWAAGVLTKELAREERRLGANATAKTGRRAIVKQRELMQAGEPTLRQLVGNLTDLE